MVFYRLRRKSVKKTEEVSVKKISLFDPGATGRVWKFLAERIRFLAFNPLAAALFGYFFQLKGKSNSPSGLRTRHSNRISFKIVLKIKDIPPQ
jgi:hypothetical protein